MFFVENLVVVVCFNDDEKRRRQPRKEPFSFLIHACKHVDMQHIEKEDFPSFLDERLEEQKGKIVNNLYKMKGRKQI